MGVASINFKAAVDFQEVEGEEGGEDVVGIKLCLYKKEERKV